MMVHTCNRTTQKTEQKDYEFSASLSALLPQIGIIVQQFPLNWNTVLEEGRRLLIFRK